MFKQQQQQPTTNEIFRGGNELPDNESVVSSSDSVWSTMSTTTTSLRVGNKREQPPDQRPSKLREEASPQPTAERSRPPASRGDRRECQVTVSVSARHVHTPIDANVERGRNTDGDIRAYLARRNQRPVASRGEPMSPISVEESHSSSSSDSRKRGRVANCAPDLPCRFLIDFGEETGVCSGSCNRNNQY